MNRLTAPPIAKSMTARSGRSDPQASTNNKQLQPPNRIPCEFYEHHIGVWGDELAAGEDGTERVKQSK